MASEPGGELLRIWIKRKSGEPMEPVESARLESGRGLVGNADQGGRRQVTLIDAGKWAETMRELGDPGVDPMARRANLLVRGIDLEQSVDRVLHLGECRLEIRGETRPCHQMDSAWQGLREALKPGWRAGAFAEVLEGGEIAIGQVVAWE